MNLRSADLIERLIGDVVSTTASYKQLQERESRLSSDFNLAQAQLFPLRKENTRVNRENQQLHADSIKQRDLISAAAENHNLELKSLENKINELNYLAVVREKDLRDMEREKERIKEVSSWLLKSFFASNYSLYFFVILGHDQKNIRPSSLFFTTFFFRPTNLLLHQALRKIPKDLSGLVLLCLLLYLLFRILRMFLTRCRMLMVRMTETDIFN